MLFCLLNDKLFPCPRTHAMHVRKLAEGFIQNGYHFKEIKSDELHHLSEVDIVYISSHFSIEPLHRLFASELQTYLVKLLHGTSASLLLWNFHTTANWEVLKTLRQKVLHLSEDLYPDAVQSELLLSGFRNDFKVFTLRYSAPFHPNLLPLVNLQKEYDFNFVGHGYQRNLTKYCEKHYRCLIRNTPPNVSEALRVNSFRRAHINLVFHAQSNIRKGIIVERFAEALSMGGIIFHDHPRISKEFPRHPAIFKVTSKGDIDDAFNQVMQCSEGERAIMRSASWQSWKQSGLSYFDQARKILALLTV